VDKQPLKIRRSLGRQRKTRSKIQLLCALIAYLLLVIHSQNKLAFKGTLWALLGEAASDLVSAFLPKPIKPATNDGEERPDRKRAICKMGRFRMNQSPIIFPRNSSALTRE